MKESIVTKILSLVTLMVNLKNLGQILKGFKKLNLQVIVELHPLNALVGFLQDLGITSEETELLTHYFILFQFFNQDLMQKILNIFKRKSQKAKVRNLPANTLPGKFLTKFGRYFLQLDL